MTGSPDNRGRDTGPWARPIPTIGDQTSASQRTADPTGWQLPEPIRAALYEVIEARRDVRRFRPDPVPDAVLTRVLGAAHAAPSVGHSQPWRFLVVRDPALRDRACILTDRERARQAAALEPDAGRRLLDLQLEGIREAPLGVVVCCDRRTPAGGVLGRATFPDADLWSCAAAIENLWLAARAEGLGLGWVTLFRPDDLAELLALPDGVVTLGWLCLGWPDERPPAPGLERAGWSRRQPLADVVLADRWPTNDAPDSPPSRLAPPATTATDALRGPDQRAVVGARDTADRLLSAPGSLGVLDRAVDRVFALGRENDTGGTLVIAAADHPVAARNVSAYPASVTAEVARAAVDGSALGATAGTRTGLTVTVVDAGIAYAGSSDGLGGARVHRPLDPRGDLVEAPAMSVGDVDRALAAGRVIGADAGRTGLVALGEIGVGNTTVAAALACGLLGADPADVVGLGAGADSAMVEQKLRVVRDAVGRAQVAPGSDPRTVLAELGGPEFAVLAGVTLGAAEVGAPVLLDGFAVCLSALVAVLLEPAVHAHLIAGQLSRERGHALTLEHLGCEPLLDLRMRAGEGVAAALAAGLLADGVAIRRDSARVDH